MFNSRFPGEPGLAGSPRLSLFILEENIWSKWHTFYRQGALPVTQPIYTTR